jgi:hypothetical protein
MKLPNRKERRKLAKEMGLNKGKSKKEKEEISQRSKAIGNLIRLRNLTEQRNSNKKDKEQES